MHCGKVVCHRSELERHIRTIHFGSGSSGEIEHTSDLDIPVLPETEFEKTEEYLEEIGKHINEIREVDRKRNFISF